MTPKTDSAIKLLRFLKLLEQQIDISRKVRQVYLQSLLSALRSVFIGVERDLVPFITVDKTIRNG